MAGGIFVPNFKKERKKNMKFSEAFKMMKQGKKVKLPSWGGYWYWNPEKETIMIQCRPQDGNKG